MNMAGSCAIYTISFETKNDRVSKKCTRKNPKAREFLDVKRFNEHMINHFFTYCSFPFDENKVSQYEILLKKDDHCRATRLPRLEHALEQD